MLAARRLTRLLRLAESVVQDTFTCTLPAGDGLAEGVAALRKDYLALVRLASSRHEMLATEITHWRKQVVCGAVDFDTQDEEGFKESLEALIAFEDALVEKFDTYAAKGLYLIKPVPVINLLRGRRAVAQSMLDSWESPEWETTGRPVVEWNAEQSQHLLQRLGRTPVSVR